MIKVTLKNVQEMVKNQKKANFIITRNFLISICKKDEESLRMVEKIKNGK